MPHRATLAAVRNFLAVRRRLSWGAFIVIAGGITGFAIGRHWDWNLLAWRQPAQLNCLGENRGIQNTSWSALRIAAGTGDFAAVNASNKEVISAPGNELRGMVTIQVEMHVWPLLHVEMIATPSWGDPASSYWRIAWHTPSTVVPIDLRAPAAKGQYHLIFAMALEMAPINVASGVNWADPGPLRWDPRTEVARWRTAQLAQAQQFGCTIAEHASPGGGFARSLDPADAVTLMVR